MAYIRKVPTASGATAVQVVHKSRGQIDKLEHIGSAHNDTDLQTLLALARERLRGTQASLLPEPNPLQIRLRQSSSHLLYTSLRECYDL